VTGGVILAAYALAAGFGAPAALCRNWTQRSPRIATGLWITLAASWLAAITLAGLALATPLSMTWQAAGSRAAGNLDRIPGGPAAAAAGMLLAGAVVLQATRHLARGLARARREHRAHAAFVAAAGHPDQALDVLIIDKDTPAAYCLPRGRHRIVISAGTLSRLSPSQLHAVLAHERAHLRGHHHLMLAVAAALARAFPAVPLLARAAAELAVLAEMTADDAAARRHDPADLAAALVTLASAGISTTALTAGGPAAITRIQRLLAPPAPPGLPVRAVRLTAGLAALMIPVVITSIPLAIAACDIITRA
jgi:Zn-dependent protease with chaperone function